MLGFPQQYTTDSLFLTLLIRLNLMVVNCINTDHSMYYEHLNFTSVYLSINKGKLGTKQ